MRTASIRGDVRGAKDAQAKPEHDGAGGGFGPFRPDPHLARETRGSVIVGRCQSRDAT